MGIKIIFSKMSFILAAGLLVGSVCHAHGGGGYHGHDGGRGEYRGGDGGGRSYHGGGGYRGRGGYYRGGGGYWGAPWYGPAVVIGVPFGGYYAYPQPACEIIQRCYPNGECIETEICG